MDINKQPPGFMIYSEAITMLSLLPDESAGRVLKAAIGYFYSGVETVFTDSVEQRVYERMIFDIQQSVTKYRVRQETGYKNRTKISNA